MSELHTRLVGVLSAVLLLGGACTPGDGETSADATDTTGDLASDTASGPTIYSGTIQFLEAGKPPCTASLSIAWDGESFPDAPVYPEGDSTASHCQIQPPIGARVPLDQVIVKYGRFDDVDGVLTGGLELQFPSADRQITTRASWEAALPTPAEGFHGMMRGSLDNFSSITWDLQAQ